MSDATERPEAAEAPEADAWAKACAEDLAAERARRRADTGGAQPGSAGEELRKLLDAVADKVTSLQSSLPGMAAQGTVSQLINQAKSAVEPVIERNPEVFDHLAAAGNELLAAYRSAVQGQEGRWTRGPARPADREDGKYDGNDGDDGPEGPSSSKHIDLD
ncbi:hypothetical protein AR457_25130 [Streptomyces agglomeratus]|uniref:DUF5304 domain-containing protein n=1 Tax=Streptomyces agglomeratus TaxID=285458 RepID=A0A1E5PCI8_9ACTN|nr:DUF5304 domain-containing protein [Streptomyces agglomeratus]OEJ27246.1 hypothetical protein AS594_25010 [Streptomyces agglomeratus]OEJ38698.1 hypothetical protein BGK70_11525 [Streptomyces agglomeratus]OEJ46916.1 hypothetical protein AR457_25130 [Streptomyces agglomeratus]OEJ51224.1 hypothetical protein BGK72_11005 [Streptomyces agglomeratus]OEJ58594.1 hypothetical protein BGM19_11915 [Streptomyces agglomeratus]